MGGHLLVKSRSMGSDSLVQSTLEYPRRCTLSNPPNPSNALKALGSGRYLGRPCVPQPPSSASQTLYVVYSPSPYLPMDDLFSPLLLWLHKHYREWTYVAFTQTARTG